jgi:hypothetical protein
MWYFDGRYVAMPETGVSNMIPVLCDSMLPSTPCLRLGSGWRV